MGRGRGGGRTGKATVVSSNSGPKSTPNSALTRSTHSKSTHSKSSRSKSTPSKQPFVCPTCSKEFEQSAEFEAHLREKVIADSAQMSDRDMGE